MTDDIGPELKVGDSAPAFALSDANGEQKTLADFSGRRTIVYFYPAAFTPGCTTEACDFRDNLASLQGAGYGVVGISGDDVAKLREFAAEDKLDFPLLSDPGNAVAKEWGSWGEKVVNGNTIVGALRSTFVIGEDGRIELSQYRVDPEGHVRRLREELGV